ncbi:MAG: dTMP kinase [Patescibacteria group bacterium]
MKNKLIVLEGIDGVGKTRLAKALVQELRKKKHPAVRYESLENKIKGFNRLKSFIKSDVSPDSSLLFYLASAIHKSENIKKLLKRRWVICDRYLYSTLASHKVRGANISLINWRKLPIIKPDYLFLIVVKDEIRLARVKKRKKKLIPLI